MSLLVRTPKHLTAAWAQRVLTAQRAGVTVTGVSPPQVDVGTTTRVWLEVDHDGPADLPRRWFVKLPSASWKARAITTLPQLPQTEVRFYREIAPRLEVSIPRVLAAESRLGRGYTLVIGDVREAGGVPGRSGEALSGDQIEAMVDLLAALHAPFWEHPDLDDALAWLAGPVRRLEDRLGTALAVPLMKRGLAKAGELIPEDLHAPAVGYARGRKQAMRALAAGPRTLIHHDCHPGNLFWTEGRAGLLDWQLVRAGEGVSDLAYLLASALAPEARRDREVDLVRRYAQALSARGVDVGDLDDLRARYRAHLCYPFEAMVVTLAVGGLMEDAVAEEMIRRTAAAVADHDAFAALNP